MTAVGLSTLRITESNPGLQIVRGSLPEPITQRILARLAAAEWRESEPWVRDDYRIAWLTVLYASEGMPDPWFQAFCTYLGASPDKLIPFFAARDFANKNFPVKYLPLQYTHRWQEDFERIKGQVLALPPKKPSASLPGQKKEAA